MFRRIVVFAALLPALACDCSGRTRTGAGELTAVEPQLYFAETCPKPTNPTYTVAPTVQDLHLRNDGTAAIYINSFAVSPADKAAIFSFDPAKVPETIAAGDTIAIPIAFLPAESGTVNATLTIKAEEQTLDIPLLGEGKALPPIPALTLNCPGGAFANQDECASGSSYVHFPEAPTNSYAEMTFSLKNTGCPALHVSNLTLTTDTPGAAANTFSLVASPGTSFDIAGGATVQLKVRLSSAIQNDFDGTLSFDTNDANRAHVSLALVGTTVGPILDLTTAVGCAHGTAFEDFSCCDFSQLTPCTGRFTLQNHGAVALTIDKVAFQTGASAQFTIQTSPAAGTTIPAFGQLTDAVVVKYTPGKKLESDLLLIDSSAGQVHSDVRGGSPPVLKTTPDSTLDFGSSVALGSETYLPISVGNELTYSQQFPLAISNLSITGSSVFTLATSSQPNCAATLNAPASIAKGETQSLCIKLAAPTFGGEYLAQLHIANDDPRFTNEKVINLHAKSGCDAAPVALIDITASDNGGCPCASNNCPATAACAFSLGGRTSVVLSGATSYDVTLDQQCQPTGQDPTAVATYEWVLWSSQGSAALNPVGSGSSKTTTLTVDTPGAHTVRLYVTDNANLKSSVASFTVNVTP